VTDEQITDTVTTTTSLTRWRWQANSGGRTYDLRLDDLHLAADPGRFPYIEGHQLSLEWADTFYPATLGRSGSDERFLPQEEFRYERPEHLAGPFWSRQITEDLRVDVSVGKPTVLFGDNLAAESVLHVSYQSGARAWNVTPVKSTGRSIVLRATD